MTTAIPEHSAAAVVRAELDEDTMQRVPIGSSRIGVRIDKAVTPIGRLWIWDRGASADSPGLPGQWFLDLDRESLDPAVLGATGWAHLLSRLGVHPIGLQPAFARALRSPEPLAIVVDTSALYGGVMTQIVRMRAGRPIHLTVPDTTFMEVQTHLERERDERNPGLTANVLRRAPHRLFRQARRLGVGPYFLRPPEALVRYFGAGKLTDEVGDGLVRGDAPSPNHHRDRMIIEAARELKRAVPDMPVWLATCDQNLAVQADTEAFHSGLAWVPELPKKPRYTSPWLLPHTLTLQHIDVSNLLADILWTFGSVLLKPDNRKDALEWRLPSDRRELALMLLARDRAFEPSNYRGTWPASTREHEGSIVPQKAPTPKAVMEALLTVAAGVASSARSTEAQYLIAMQWASASGEAISLTSDGQAAASVWKAIEPRDAEAWCVWMKRASLDVQRLPTIKSLLGILTEPGMGDDALGKALGIAARNAESQAVLAAVFGATVRLGGKNWRAADVVDEGDDERAIVDCMRRLRQEDLLGSVAVRTDRLFTALLPTGALPLHRFRRAIISLVRRHVVEPGGSTQMAEPKNAVILRALVRGDSDEVPQVGLFDVNLGVGSFLLPDQPSQVLTLIEGAPA